MGEFWFEVRTPTGVVTGDGTTRIDTLSPGRRYEAIGRDDHWVIVPEPGDTLGYVPVSRITVLEDVFPPPPPPPAASPPSAHPSAPPPPAEPAASTQQPPSEPESANASSTSRPGKTSVLAVASLALGIVWLAWIGSVAAVILGHISLIRISRSEGRETGRGFAIAGLVLGYSALAVFVVLVAVSIASRGEDEQGPGIETVAPLLPGQQLSLSGTMGDVVEFIETDDGRAVYFEGQGTVSVTFGTSGGPASGNFTVTMSGTDSENNEYVVDYTGVLDGTYFPEDGTFEGTVVITGDAPPGLEAAIPDATIWDGGVVVSSDGCARSEAECAYGSTQPDVELYWEMQLPLDTIDPAYLARLD